MKEKNLDRILFLCIGILISFCLVCLFAFIQIDSEDIPEELNVSVAESEQEIINDCKNLSLIDASECINSHISEIFFYNESNTEVKIKEMSFSRLKNEGGVCKHYNNYIEKIGNALGFSSEHVTLLPEIAHGFSVLYDNETNDYCVLDMNNLIGCINLK